MHINWVQDTLAQKNMQNEVKERMLIAIQQRKSDIIGTGKHIARGGLESHLQPI